MKILVLNSGSSSVKFQLRNSGCEELICKGLIERIGEKGGAVHIKFPDGRQHDEELDLEDHIKALDYLLKVLVKPELDILGSLSEIDAVGHRVVHGGESYSKSVLLNDEALKTIDELSGLAPLHNPPNLKGILACREILPNAPQVGVFDTAFHQTMPQSSFMYAIPRELYDKFGVRRYGFHGTSHSFIHTRARKLSGLDDKPSKIATAHLGNGCSIAAVLNGEVLDTSMGFTPLEGLVMGTRPGDIDPALISFLVEKGYELSEIMKLLQKKSGLLGLSNGLSNDMRTLLEKSERDKNARLAFEVFCYRLKKYIGAYAAALGGLDVLVFSGGIGEGSAVVRNETCRGLEFLGIEIDEEKNNDGSGKEALISKDSSNVKVYVIPTNEELMIAKETELIVGDIQNSQ
ncbi:MAG: acetate kinase [Verrucomicrobia bacterium]|nr:acetate kinase [Verrucomicrobiota bacterium]